MRPSWKFESVATLPVWAIAFELEHGRKPTPAEYLDEMNRLFEAHVQACVKWDMAMATSSRRRWPTEYPFLNYPAVNGFIWALGIASFAAVCVFVAFRCFEIAP